MALHFIGFRGLSPPELERTYINAVRLFGVPDHMHPKATFKVLGGIPAGDTVVFGPRAFPADGPRRRVPSPAPGKWKPLIKQED